MTARPDPVMTPVGRVVVGDRVAPANGWSSMPDRVVVDVTRGARNVTLRFERVPGLPITGSYDADAYVPVRPR